MLYLYCNEADTYCIKGSLQVNIIIQDIKNYCINISEEINIRPSIN